MAQPCRLTEGRPLDQDGFLTEMSKWPWARPINQASVTALKR